MQSVFIELTKIHICFSDGVFMFFLLTEEQ